MIRMVLYITKGNITCSTNTIRMGTITEICIGAMLSVRTCVIGRNLELLLPRTAWVLFSPVQQLQISTIPAVYLKTVPEVLLPFSLMTVRISSKVLLTVKITAGHGANMMGIR